MLGLKVRDELTGFTGVVTARCQYLHGVTRVEITPTVGTDGAFRETQWFEEARIVPVDGPFAGEE